MKFLACTLILVTALTAKADLQSVSNADLETLVIEADRRLQAFERWEYVQAESQKVLDTIEYGQVAQPRSVKWASELQNVRSQIAQMKQFQSPLDVQCQELIRQLEVSFEVSHGIIRDQVSQSYYFEDSKVFDRVQYEILMYQQLTWADLIQRDAEKGQSSLLPGVARSCQIKNRDQFKSVVQNLSQAFFRFHQALYGVPGYKSQHEFLQTSSEHAVNFYERERNIFIGTLVVGAGLPKLIASIPMLARLSKVVTIGSLAMGGWIGYEVASSLSKENDSMVLPGEEEIRSLLGLHKFVVEADKMQFVDLIDVLRTYNDNIEAEKSKAKRRVKENLEMLKGYIQRYGSVEASVKHLSQKVKTLQEELDFRKNRSTKK